MLVPITVFVLIMSGLLVVIDQFIKIWVLDNLLQTSSIVLIPGFLQLTYVENRGAAFGIFQGKVEILSILTLAVIVVGIVMLLMGKFKSKLSLLSVGLIIAGGTGNLIDRIIRSFVVDYLDISLWFNFPVFNFADCCVVVGTILLMIYLLFSDEKENVCKKQDGENCE